MKDWALSLKDLCSYVDWRSMKESHRNYWRKNRHSNSAYELHMVLDGACELELGERRLRMRAGQGVLIPPGFFHACMEHSRPFLRMTLTFIPNAARVTLPEQPTTFSFSSEESALCASVFAEYDNLDRLYRQERLAALVFLLMVDVLRRVSPQDTDAPQESDADYLVEMDKFFSGENLVSRPSRRALAAQLHISERQLNRLMQETFGMSFREKLLASRVDYAKYLLRTTALHVSEIAYRAGYSTEGAFHKAFRLRVGMTPARFREQHRE